MFPLIGAPVATPTCLHGIQAGLPVAGNSAEGDVVC